VWAGGDWPQAISLDLCREHLDEARRPATGQSSSQTPAPVADQPESGGPTEKLGALQDDQPTPRWHPKVGDRVIVAVTNRAARVTAELLHDRFEVEPETGRNAVEPGKRYEVYALSELRPEHPRD
jgi:hypothetical protein